MRTTLVAALCACLLLAVPVAAIPGTALASPSPAATASEAGPPAGPPGTADAVPVQSVDGTAATQQFGGADYIEIQVQEDGNARITLGMTLPAGNDSERAAFQQTAEEFEAGEYDLGYTVFESALPDVADATGREMSLSASTYEASIDAGVGRLEQRFTWQGFAGVENETISVRDAFTDGQDVWLRTLGEGQRLVVRSPPGYAISESPSGPQISNGALVWTGPATFDAAAFTIAFDPETGGGDGLAIGMTTVAIGLFAVLALVLLVSGALYLRREDGSVGDAVTALLGGSGDDEGEGAASSTGADSGRTGSGAGPAEGEAAEPPAAGEAGEPPDRSPGETPTAATDAGAEGDAGAADSADASGASAPTSETSTSAGDAAEEPDSGSDGAAAAGGGAAAASATDEEESEGPAPDVDPELLSDEERVQFLLEENGGRMKQANIVKETGWSNAKVSQLLSRMDEDDEVDKLRIGRENLISLPDVDVTDGQ